MGKRLVQLVALASAGASVAHAIELVGRQGQCFSSCNIPLAFLRFSDFVPEPSFWAGRLRSDVFMTSLVACMTAYCDKQEIADGWERLEAFRDLGAPGEPVPAYADVLARIDDLGAVPVVDTVQPEVRARMWNHTVCSSRKNYLDSNRADDAFARQMTLHNTFGACMYLLLAVMLLVNAVNRFIVFMSSRSNGVDAIAAMAPLRPGSTWSRAYTWYRRHIGVPAAFGHTHIQPWGILSIPTRIQTVLIGVYILINIVFSIIGYELFEDNMFWWHRTDIQLVRYVSDRTGIMSFYNMVFLWLLAGRNDIVIWLTGWSFQSMNIFHRWVAVVATIQVIVHSIGYSILKWGSWWDEFWKQTYWHTGVVATVAFCLIIPLSMRPVRARFYETFLNLHIVLSLLVLLLLYFHVEQFGYLPWVWICLGIWVLDRVARVIRLSYLSFRTVIEPNTTAAITATDPSLMRLSVTSSVRIEPRPGDYFFLYSSARENHPFTLASWERNPSGGTTLHFLIAPLAGWTAKIRRRIEKAALGRASMAIALEGPYGHECPVDTFENVVLIAGGSGIACILPYIVALSKSPRKHHITVVWTVRNIEYAADVLRHELEVSRTEHIDLQLSLTKQDPAVARAMLHTLAKQPSPEDGEVNEASPLLLPAGGMREDLHFTAGRPDMRVLLAKHVGALVGQARLAVLACGPGQMMDDLRRAVAESYGQGEGQVEGWQLEYFEESFVW